MNTYYIDLSWRGGVIVMAESKEIAAEIIREYSDHGKYIENLESELKMLTPNTFYDFMGDS